jgi:hypothetical protein
MGNACTHRVMENEEVDNVKVRSTVYVPVDICCHGMNSSEPKSDSHSKSSSITGKIKDSSKFKKRISKVSELVESKLADYVNQDDSFIEDFGEMKIDDDQDSVRLEYDEPDVEGRAKQARQIVSLYIKENPNLIANPANIKTR